MRVFRWGSEVHRTDDQIGDGLGGVGCRGSVAFAMATGLGGMYDVEGSGFDEQWQWWLWTLRVLLR